MAEQEYQEMTNIQCAEDITLLNLRQVCALSKCWNVKVSGLRHKKDIEEKLIKLWLSHRKEEHSDSWESPDFAGGFKEHQQTQQRLLEIYPKAEALYDNLTPNIKANLEQSYHNVCTLIKERKDSLKSGECTIVIAGEVGAGKTSLLNLILETQIFPTDSLKCTNTIIEIRSSEKKDAIFYFKPRLSDSGERERKVPPKIISLNSLDGIQEFKNCVDQSDDNTYDRCEVFYPFKILSKGVVIVDTPGIDGWGNIDQRLQTYFSRASGFIYVINMITAATDQQSRLLSHLLKTVVNSSEDFSPEASLFIGNKWEHVPERDRFVVQKDIFYKMNQVYPGIRQTQIHYMSVKKAAEFKMKYETKLEEYKILMFKVSQLVSSSLRQGMVSYYWWLSLLLSRSLYLLRETCGHRAMTHEEQYRDTKWLRKHFDDLQLQAYLQLQRGANIKRNVFLELEDDLMMYKLPNLVNEIAELLGQLDIFYINDIMKFDFELSELEWQNKMELGNGRFAKVYKSKLARNNRPIAIKVATDVVNQSNVRQILTEDRIMRDLKHANIVRYYGASYIKTKSYLQWIMVMELCQTTLKQIYTGSERSEHMIPGCLDSDHPQFAQAAKYMLDHATQICTGLDYIHEKGYTHRDMKLENVLLAEGNVIKITDVGATKVTQMLCKAADGSPAYMAPEVLLSNEIQTNKIDIYSFSLIFWEMWFGKDVADEINKHLLGYGYHGNAIEVLKSQIARTDGWRPPLGSPKRPPEMLTDVLKRGWAFDPEKRPSANEFGNTLKQFLKNNLLQSI